MNDINKKHFSENERGVSYNSYNLNSFRVVSNHHIEKNKYEKESKLLSPRMILQSVEKPDKDDFKKQQIKPRLLTAKLPSAFDVKYKRNTNENTNEYGSSPRKLVANEKYKFNSNDNNFHICITEEDELSVSKREMRFMKKQNSAKNPKKLNPGIFLSDSDSKNDKLMSYKKDHKRNSNEFEKDVITRPIVVKQTSNIVNRIKSASPSVKDKSIPINNYFISNPNSNVHSDSKSTGNNSQGSSSQVNSNYNSNPSSNTVNVSRTHESFFPKIKNNFEMDEQENTHILNQINKKFNSNNVILNLNKNSNKRSIIEESLTLDDIVSKQFNIRLEDGISLSLIKNNSYKRIKKLFHVPNFEIYFVKEMPLTGKFFISDFKEKLNYWNSNIGNSSRFIKIFNEYVNNPEGYISLVIEYMQGFSLQDILENIGCLNESIICKMAIQIIQSFHEYNEKMGENYPDLCSCDILFDKKGNLKLMPNFLHQIQRQYKEEDSTNLNNILINKLAKCKCVEFFHKNFFTNFSNQYFKLGYVLLICASGGLNFESLSIFFEEFSNINNTTFLKIKKNMCCLYHLLLSIEEDEERKINSKIKISNFINNKYFSDNFLDFLCQCLSFSQKPNHNTLITNHPWIKITNYIYMNNNCNKVRVIMKEVIKISREFKRYQLKLNNVNEAKLNNFLNNFEIILSNNKHIRKDELILAIETKKDVIKDLTFELGINSKDLIAQLQEKVSYDLKN